VIYGEGTHTAILVPRDALCRAIAPASATYEILDLRRSESDSDRVVQASAAATISSVSTTLAATAGPGNGDDYALTLTSATGVVVGHTYRISEGALTEAVTIAGLSGTSARTLAPLQNDYTGSATFTGIELSGTIPSALSDEEDQIESAGGGPFAIIWRYTIDSIDYVIPTQFFLSRYSIPCPATPADVAAYDPRLARKVAASHLTYTQALNAAMLDFIGELDARHISPTHALLQEAGKLAVIKKSCAKLAMWMENEADLADKYDAEYHAQMEHIGRGRAPLGTVDVDCTSAVAEAGSSTKRRGILARC